MSTKFLGLSVLYQQKTLQKLSPTLARLRHFFIQEKNALISKAIYLYQIIFHLSIKKSGDVTHRRLGSPQSIYEVIMASHYFHQDIDIIITDYFYFVKA